MADRSGAGVYSIGAVVRMLGVPAGTLRTWEERYSIVSPERSQGGHRLYSREQVEQLRFVLRSVEQGMSPADGHRLLAERLAGGGRVRLTDPQTDVSLLILLAERDSYAAEFTDYFLRTEGYETIVVLDAAEAKAQFDERSPSLVLVDLLMSGGGGYELCRTLKRQTDIPIVAVSTLESRTEALECGADAFFQKPIDPLQLVSMVRDLLGTSAYLRSKQSST